MATRASGRPPTFNPVAFVEVISEASGGIATICACLRDIEQARTERARIEADARVHIERIRATREVLMSYLDRSFDERRELFSQLFERIDRAIDEDNVQLVSVSLSAMVDLAKSSPFKALQDAAAFQRALDDDTDWRF